MFWELMHGFTGIAAFVAAMVSWLGYYPPDHFIAFIAFLALSMTQFSAAHRESERRH